MSMSHGFAMNGNEPVFSDQERIPVDIETFGIQRSFYPLANNQELVRQFHVAFNAPAADNPKPIGPIRGFLRKDMLKEELEEFERAVSDNDIVEQYDALLDLLVLAYGGLVEMGIDAGPGFREVMRANMSKLGKDGKPIVSRGFDVDGFPEGKILKGPDYIKPDLFNELVKQNWTPTYREFLVFYYPDEVEYYDVMTSTKAALAENNPGIADPAKAQTIPKIGVESGTLTDLDDNSIDLNFTDQGIITADDGTPYRLMTAPNEEETK